jgi:hypothetical protein
LALPSFWPQPTIASARTAAGAMKLSFMPILQLFYFCLAGETARQRTPGRFRSMIADA